MPPEPRLESSHVQVLPALAALRLTACGAPTTPGAEPGSQTARATEPQEAQTWGRACAVRVLVKLVELNAPDYSFVTPSATCTNAFLGQDALPLPRTFKSSAIAAAPDFQTAQGALISRTNRAYVTSIDLDGTTTFSAL